MASNLMPYDLELNALPLIYPKMLLEFLYSSEILSLSHLSITCNSKIPPITISLNSNRQYKVELHHTRNGFCSIHRLLHKHCLTTSAFQFLHKKHCLLLHVMSLLFTNDANANRVLTSCYNYKIPNYKFKKSWDLLLDLLQYRRENGAEYST